MKEITESSFQKRLERKIQEAEQEKIKAEMKKKLEEAMRAKGIIPPPEKSKAHKALINIITFIITAPWLMLVFIGALAYGAFAWGVVLNLFWKWFVLSVFPTLPTIKLGQAIGLMLVINLFDKNIPQVVSDELVNDERKNILDLISPWMILLAGLVIKFIVLPLF